MKPRGFKYVLTCKDSFSKFHWLLPTKCTDTDTIAEELERNIFGVWGLPEKLVTDNAKSFTSKKMKELCEKLNITLRTTVTYNPSSNAVERSHSIIGKLFVAFEDESRTDWKKLIPSMTLAMNSSVNRVSGFSPIFMMTGRPPRLERRIINGDNLENQDEMEQSWGIEEKMERVFNKCKENVGKHLQYCLKHYLEDDAVDF